MAVVMFLSNASATRVGMAFSAVNVRYFLYKLEKKSNNFIGYDLQQFVEPIATRLEDIVRHQENVVVD